MGVGWGGIGLTSKSHDKINPFDSLPKNGFEFTLELFPVGEEVKMSSGDESQTASEETERHCEDQKARIHCCVICGKAFSTRSGLCQHKKNHHGGAKPHKCIHCGKRFAYRNPLTVHLRTHTKEKPFLCPLCGKGFSLMGHVRSHMKIHSKKTSVETNLEEGEEAVGGLINSDGEEVEWDPASLGEWTLHYFQYKFLFLCCSKSNRPLYQLL